MRPVRLPPCAAGARPTTRMRAAGSPKPGTGRPQYVQSRNRATRSAATRLRWATSRGHSRQRTSRAVSRRSPSLAAKDSSRDEERMGVAHRASHDLALTSGLHPDDADRGTRLGTRNVRRDVPLGILERGLEAVTGGEPLRRDRLHADAIEGVPPRRQDLVTRAEEHTQEWHRSTRHDLDQLTK